MFILKPLKAGLLVACLLISPITFAKSVGTVTFKTGNPTIIHADTTTSPAEKNTALNAGDTIETGNGRLQLSLIDGGKVSLQPNTVYKISKYEFSGKEDGSEFAFTELIKGGLRTVSGLIGHKNRDRYQLKTAVATIGIRGTEFTVNFNDNQLLMTTNHGSVDVCNQGGCLNALTGQTIVVSGVGASPKPSNTAAKAAAVAPAAGKAVFAASDSTAESGLPNVIANAVNAGNSGGSSSVYDMLYLHTEVTNGAHENGSLTGSVTTDSNGKVTDFQDTNSSISYTFNSPLGYTPLGYKDDYVRMGSTLAVKTDNNTSPSISESLSNFQGIVGTFSSSSNLLNLASLANPAMTYTVLASTAPAVIGTTSPFNATSGTANLVNGSMTVNFATLAYGYSLNNIAVGSNVFSINSIGTNLLTGSTSKFSGNAAVTEVSGLPGNIYTCLSSCIGHLANGNIVEGAFFGSNAERAGLQYGFTTNVGDVFGSVVLGR